MIELVVPLIGLALSLGVCVLVIAIGIRRNAQRTHLIHNGIPVRATIVSIRAKSLDSTFAYIPTVRYRLYGRVWESEPAGGQHMMRTGTMMKTRRSADRFIGHPLDVVVNPTHPLVSAVPGRDRPGILLVTIGSVFGAMILLIGGVGVIMGIVLRL